MVFKLYVTRICFYRAINEYIHCLDKTSDSCLSVESLLWLGINRNDAVIYESMVRQMKYQCGAAYQSFLLDMLTLKVVINFYHFQFSMTIITALNWKLKRKLLK